MDNSKAITGLPPLEVLSKFQVEFLHLFNESERETNWIFSAPAGAGKTLVISHIISRILEQDHHARILYLTPYKAAAFHLKDLMQQSSSTFESRLIDRKAYLSHQEALSGNDDFWPQGHLYISTLSMSQRSDMREKFFSEDWTLVVIEDIPRMYHDDDKYFEAFGNIKGQVLIASTEQLQLSGFKSYHIELQNLFQDNIRPVMGEPRNSIPTLEPIGYEKDADVSDMIRKVTNDIESIYGAGSDEALFYRKLLGNAEMSSPLVLESTADKLISIFKPLRNKAAHQIPLRRADLLPESFLIDNLGRDTVEYISAEDLDRPIDSASRAGIVSILPKLETLAQTIAESAEDPKLESLLRLQVDLIPETGDFVEYIITSYHGTMEYLLVSLEDLPVNAKGYSASMSAIEREKVLQGKLQRREIIIMTRAALNGLKGLEIHADHVVIYDGIVNQSDPRVIATLSRFRGNTNALPTFQYLQARIDSE